MVAFLQKNWPSIKMVIYYVLAAGLGFASTRGWISAADAATWTDYAGTAITTLGSLFFVIAGKNVNRPEAIDPPVTVGPPAITIRNPETLSVQDIQKRIAEQAQVFATTAGSTVANARAELERRFGR